MIVGLAGFLASAAFSLRGIRPPRVHDEFSYLLAADTFAAGRLTNPAHPFWTHFETMHILQQPTYMSKYPPGQGLALALGQALTGYPMVGVWISIAAVCAAACWLLQGWLRPRWALLGGLLAVLWLAPTYWGQSYWGGAVAACGGALLYGALPRIVRQQRWWAGFHVGLGLAMMIYSRPYEGLVASLPAAVVLLVWLVKLGMRGAVTQGLPVMAATMAVLAPAAAWLLPITQPSRAIRWSCPTRPTARSMWPPRHSFGRRWAAPLPIAIRKWPIIHVGWERPQFLRKQMFFG